MLNFEEYLVFVEKEKASLMIRREPEIVRSKNEHKEMYDTINKITPGVDGLSKEDLIHANVYCSLCDRQLESPSRPFDRSDQGGT